MRRGRQGAGPAMIEQMFDRCQSKRREMRRNTTGQPRVTRGVGTDRIHLIADLTRTVAMLLLAWLLVLVGLPIAVAALGT